MPKPRHHKAGLFIILITFILTLLGCVHSPLPSLPEYWVSEPDITVNLSDPPDKAVLQIILAYAPISCSHTALRLVCPEKPVIFWDPGGGYGRDFEKNVRKRDLILLDPPDLETYLMFRWKNNDQAVEIFEWYISKDYACDLYSILMNGTENEHSAGRFNTLTPSMFCAVAVSDFLNRFAKQLMTVNEKYFFPHALAQTLYSQSPDQVLIFKRKGDGSVYVQKDRVLPHFSFHLWMR